MSAGHRSVAVALAVVAASVAAPAVAAPATLTVAPATVQTQLGREFMVRSTIRNDDPSVAVGLIAHLTVFSLRDGTYVDPEDWSVERTRYLRPLAPGGTTTLEWKLKAVNGGTFDVSILAVAAGSETSTASTAPPVRVDVAARTTLNEGGILWLSAGIPLGLSIVALALRLRRRRRPRPLRAAPS